MPKAVTEMELPTKEAFWQELFPQQQPIVFRGAIRGWELVTAGKQGVHLIDRFVRLIGHRTIPVATGLPAEGLMRYADRDHLTIKNFLEGERTFKDVAPHLHRTTDNDPYFFMRSVPIAERLPELAPYFTLSLLEGTTLLQGQWRLWLGSGGHHTQIHHDALHNFACLLAGRKRFTVFPPEVLASLYLGPWQQGPSGVTESLVDPRDPDLKRFPKFADALAQSREVVLEAGDIFFLPALWWHHVESNGFNAMASYWWQDIKHASHLAAEQSFLQAALSLKSLPLHWRNYYRALFEHFIFQTAGDPCAHLPPEKQGILGTPTAERLSAIRKRVTELEFRTHMQGISDRKLRGERFVLSPTIFMRILDDGTVHLVDACGRVNNVVLPEEHFEIIREFRVPRSAEEVMAALGKEGWNFEDADALKVVRSLANEGVLVAPLQT